MSSPLARWLPPLSVFLLVLPWCWAVLHPDQAVSDPGVGWHLKMGQLLVEQKAIPLNDPFSYTVPGREWINYQWLFEAVLGLLQLAGGVPLVTAVCMILIGWVAVVILGRMQREGDHFLAAWFMAFAVWLVMTMHQQDRPHVVSYLFFALFVSRLRAWEHAGAEDGWRYLAVLPLLMLLWCNMHAGFTAGLALLGLHAGGSTLEWWFGRKALNWRKPLALWGAFLAGCLASLANPYGWLLHVHILSVLGMKSLVLWHEHQPPWMVPSANMGIFALMVLAWIWVMAARLAKPSWAEVLSVVFFLLMALKSARHVNFFMLAAVLIVARGMTEWLRRKFPVSTQRFTSFSLQQAAAGRPAAVWMAAVSVLVVSTAWLCPVLYNAHPERVSLSEPLIEYIGKSDWRQRRIFNTDDVGGALVYRFGPGVRVFMDDRADLYGDAFVQDMYLPLLGARAQWQQILEAYGVDVALVPKGSALEKAMGESPEWVRDFEDESHVVFLRKGA